MFLKRREVMYVCGCVYVYVYMCEEDSLGGLEEVHWYECFFLFPSMSYGFHKSVYGNALGLSHLPPMFVPP